MKREYFVLLVLLSFVILILGLGYIFGEEKVTFYLKRFIVIIVLLFYFLGQYSMRFPKRL